MAFVIIVSWDGDRIRREQGCGNPAKREKEDFTLRMCNIIKIYIYIKL